MIKKLNITVLLIIIMIFNQLNAQSDKILLHGSCNIDDSNQLLDYLQNFSNIELGFEKNTAGDISFSKYPIIFLCGDSYLKLSEIKIQELNRMILNDSLLLIDNYKSDYTLSIFLNKLLTEYPESNNSISEIFINNPYRVDFEKLQFDSKQVYINKKLRVLAIKEKSILQSELNNDNNIKLVSSIIFNYLIGN